jgi:hypothetical protein
LSVGLVQEGCLWILVQEGCLWILVQGGCLWILVHERYVLKIRKHLFLFRLSGHLAINMPCAVHSVIYLSASWKPCPCIFAENEIAVEHL